MPSDEQVELETDLLYYCQGLGEIKNDTFITGSEVTESLRGISSMLRRDSPSTQDIHIKLGNWEIMETHLLPLLISNRREKSIIISCVKLLVRLTMTPTIESGEPLLRRQQHLQQAKHNIIKGDTLAILATWISEPLSIAPNIRSQKDKDLLELFVTLFKNLLQIPNPESKVTSSDLQLFLHDRTILKMYEENILDILVMLASQIQHAPEFRLLLLDSFAALFRLETVERLFVSTSKSSSSSVQNDNHKDSKNMDSKNSELEFQDEVEPELTEHEILKRSLAEAMNRNTQSHRALLQQAPSRHSRFGTLIATTNKVTGQATSITRNVFRKDNVLSNERLAAHHGRRGLLDKPPRQFWNDRVRGSICKTLDLLLDISLKKKSIANTFNQALLELFSSNHVYESSDYDHYFQLISLITGYYTVKTKRAIRYQKRRQASKGSDVKVPIFDISPIWDLVNQPTFDFATKRIKNHLEIKPLPYNELTTPTMVIKEITHALYEAVHNNDADEGSDKPYKLAREIFYDAENIDLHVKLIKLYLPYRNTPQHLVNLVHCVHYSMKILNTLAPNGQLVVLGKRRKKVVRKKNPYNPDWLVEDELGEEINGENEGLLRLEEKVGNNAADDREDDIVDSDLKQGQETELAQEDVHGAELGKESEGNTLPLDAEAESVLVASSTEAKIESERNSSEEKEEENKEREITEAKSEEVTEELDFDLTIENQEKKSEVSGNEVKSKDSSEEVLNEEEGEENSSKKKKKKKKKSNLSEADLALMQLQEEDDDMDDGYTQNERWFNVNNYVLPFAHQTVIQNLSQLLARYDRNSAETTAFIVHIFDALAFEKKLHPLFYQLSLFQVFETVLLDDNTRGPNLVRLRSFCKKIIRKFFDQATDNPLLFIEVFFWKNILKVEDLALPQSLEARRARAEERETMRLDAIEPEVFSDASDDDNLDWGDLKRTDDFDIDDSTALKTRWSQREIDTLKTNYVDFQGEEDYLDILSSLLPGRSSKQVLAKLKSLGLVATRKRTKGEGKMAAMESDSDDADDISSFITPVQLYQFFRNHSEFNVRLLEILTQQIRYCIELRTDLPDAVPFALVPIIPAEFTYFDSKPIANLMRFLGFKAPSVVERHAFWRIPAIISPEALTGLIAVLENPENPPEGFKDPADQPDAEQAEGLNDDVENREDIDMEADDTKNSSSISAKQGSSSQKRKRILRRSHHSDSEEEAIDLHTQERLDELNDELANSPKVQKLSETSSPSRPNATSEEQVNESQTQLFPDDDQVEESVPSPAKDSNFNDEQSVIENQTPDTVLDSVGSSSQSQFDADLQLDVPVSISSASNIQSDPMDEASDSDTGPGIRKVSRSKKRRMIADDDDSEDDL